MSNFYLDKLNGPTHEGLFPEMENDALSRERKSGLLCAKKDLPGHKKAKPATVMMKSPRSNWGSFLSHLGNIDGCLKMMDLSL